MGMNFTLPDISHQVKFSKKKKVRKSRISHRDRILNSLEIFFEVDEVVLVVGKKVNF